MAWSEAYRFDRHRRIGFFTLLKKKEMDERLASAFPGSGSVAYGVFTAAEDQAPHVRQNKTWVFYHGILEGRPGPEWTNPLQTWLDLRQAGGRGEEAAEAILLKRLEPVWVKGYEQ